MTHHNKGNKNAMIGSEPLSAQLTFRTQEWRKNRYTKALEQKYGYGGTFRDALTPILDKWADDILGDDNE